MQLALGSHNSIIQSPISPLLEMGAYEALWLEDGAWFKNIAERFASDPDALPSDFIPRAQALERAREAQLMLSESGIKRFGIRIHHAGDYPAQLRDAEHPIELLYYQGAWELAETPGIAVVGARKASEEGIKRAKRIARELVKNNYTVVSGLASGIDTAVHTEAISQGGFTIAVIGTPLNAVYPKENTELQQCLAADYLVISQVPILRYARQIPKHNRFFFPARNITMSALTKATIIVEASDTSGTLHQARAAIQQKRKLFILESCFENPNITWPERFLALGAIRLRDPEDIWKNLE